MRTKFDIVGSFNKQPINNFDAQRTVNLFEYTDTEGKKGKILINTSGLIERFDISGMTQGWRNSFVFQGFAYFVVADSVYRMDSNLIRTLLGTITTSNGFVGIEANTHQVIFVDGVFGYIYDVNTGVFQKITSPGFPTLPIDVAFLDGFFVVPAGGTNTLTLSSLNDGLTWDALDSAAINTHPGNITAIQTLHRKLFIFAKTFCEVWENAGLADFAFRRNNSLLIEYGTDSVASVVTGYDKMFFLSQDLQGLGHVIMVSGTQAIPISNQALDYELNNYAVVSDAVGIVYQDWGIIFYRLNFTNANKTWVYNVSQSSGQGDLRWHTEEMLDGDRHIAQTHFYLNNKHYFGAYDSGKCFEISNTTYSNGSESIKRERVSSAFYVESNNKVRIDRLYIDLVQGDAKSSGIDANPLVFLAFSIDGGKTYSNEMASPMGDIGENTFRTIFRKLGAGRTFIFRLRFYNQNKFVILGSTIDYEELPE